MCYENACSAIAHVSKDRRASYDVIMCDVLMPDCSGVDLFMAVRRERPDLADRFLFLTGADMMPVVDRFIEFSGRPVLRKPFGEEDMTKAFRSMGLDPGTPGM